MAGEATTEVLETPPDVASFTTIEQFDARIAELRDSPTTANLVALTEVAAARDAHRDAEAAADAALNPPAAEAPSDATEPAAPALIADPAPVADPALVAASVAPVATPAAADGDPTPTQSERPHRRRATINAVAGQTYITPGPVTSNAALARALNAAAKGSGDATVLTFAQWDREQIADRDILKASNSPGDNARILGITDEHYNEVDVTSYRSATVQRAKVHRADCGGCSDCGSMLDRPDSFRDYPEPLGDTIDSVPADSCAWNLHDETGIGAGTQEVYVYCGKDSEDADASGILQEDGTVIPIDPANPATWKSTQANIAIDFSAKTRYSLEEFPLLFTVDRAADMCDEENVSRTINKYLAVQSRLMDARKFGIITAKAVADGHAGTVAAGISDSSDDLVAFLGVFLAAIAESTGVELDGSVLAAPVGFQYWVNARTRRANLADRLNDTFGISRIVEIQGIASSPFLKTFTPATPLAFDLDAEVEKAVPIAVYDPRKWRKPTGETVRIGVTDKFRDFDLAQQNKRGVVVLRDETLIPVAVAPAASAVLTLCASGTEPGRVTLCEPPAE